MIRQISYIESDQYDPYRNLAMEEYLFFHCKAEECILYLWQNHRTVVIGRNQDAWRECQISGLETEGGHLARRKSGGGAVYHDLGNLNFTFVAHRDNFDVKRQLEVIQKALKMLGVDAELSGRNDILIGGRKFSGNAFYEHDNLCCHHGTLMMDVDIDALGRYLTVSKEKIASKGIPSVHSRIVNLKEFLPCLTLEKLKEALRFAFESVYCLKSDFLSVAALDKLELTQREVRFSSPNWIYGSRYDLQNKLSKRFLWGELNLQIQTGRGKITDAAMDSDALQTEIIQQIPAFLIGSHYTPEAVCTALNRYTPENEQEVQMKADIIAWVLEVVLKNGFDMG